jgi:hypothetical protein
MPCGKSQRSRRSLAGCRGARASSQDTVAKPVDGGVLSLVGNAHAGEGPCGGVALPPPDAMHGSCCSKDGRERERVRRKMS